MLAATPCSCGLATPHVVAERRTFDRAVCRLWSDGLFELHDDGVTRYARVPLARAWRALELVPSYDAPQAFALAHWSSRAFLLRFASFGVVVPPADA